MPMRGDIVLFKGNMFKVVGQMNQGHKGCVVNLNSMTGPFHYSHLSIPIGRVLKLNL